MQFIWFLASFFCGLQPFQYSLLLKQFLSIQDTERRDSIPEEDGEGQGHLRQMKPIYEVDKQTIKKFDDDGVVVKSEEVAVKSAEVAVDSTSVEKAEKISNDEKLNQEKQ